MCVKPMTVSEEEPLSEEDENTGTMRMGTWSEEDGNVNSNANVVFMKLQV